MSFLPEPPYRVLKCDVVKMKFLKSWDLSGYSERTMAYLPKMSISGQIVSEIVALLCLENSIQTLLNMFLGRPKKIRRVCMEFSEHNRLTSQRQFAPQCSFLVSRPLGHCSFRGNACPQTPRFWKTPLDISRFGSFVN